MAADTAPDRQALRFLLLYALAVAGGAIAYVPFLTILLPIAVTKMVGESDVTWLAYATFVGAIGASVANIGFGWLSDRTGVRKPWIIAGLILSSAMLVSFAHLESIIWVIVMLFAWQLGLNMMLSPLAAWAGDSVPDRQKGLLGGMLAFAPAAGALSATVVTIPGLAGPEGRLWLVAALVAACVLPALLLGKPKPFPDLMDEDQVAPRAAGIPTFTHRLMIVRMWLARLLIQISEAALFAFLYFWFRSVSSMRPTNQRPSTALSAMTWKTSSSQVPGGRPVSPAADATRTACPGMPRYTPAWRCPRTAARHSAFAAAGKRFPMPMPTAWPTACACATRAFPGSSWRGAFTTKVTPARLAATAWIPAT